MTAQEKVSARFGLSSKAVDAQSANASDRGWPSQTTAGGEIQQ